MRATYSHSSILQVDCLLASAFLPRFSHHIGASMRAFIFPGQGSQSVGMGAALAGASLVARHLFEEVDEALRQSLSRLMAEGPAEELTLTENAQPAIMANSV